MQVRMDDSARLEPEATLHLERPLLTIDQYAAAKEVSQSVVRDFIKLGIVQTRKHKGKTFVIDVPISACSCDGETLPRADEKANDSSKISALAQKLIGGQPKVAPKPAFSDSSIASDKTPKEVSGKAHKDLFKATGDLEAETVKGEWEDQFTQASGGNDLKSRFLAVQVNLKRIWQIAAISLIACLGLIVSCWIWSYANSRGQVNELHTRLTGTYSDFIAADKKANETQAELNDSRLKLGRVKNELYESRLEIEAVQEALAIAKQRFEEAKQRSARAAQTLSRQSPTSQTSP